MIIIDTGPLVGLINPRDGLFTKARADIQLIDRRSLFVTVPVLTEVFYMLRTPIARQKLMSLFDELNVIVRDVSPSLITAALDWMEKYADHEPDFADATTVVLVSEIKGARVWTYDSEFRTTWRRLNGSAIPLATQ